jgi:hypothetical protein
VRGYERRGYGLAQNIEIKETSLILSTIKTSMEKETFKM